MDDRFRDQGLTIHDFTDEFLVVCPKCRRCAMVISARPSANGSSPPRVACAHCGYARDLHVPDRMVVLELGRRRLVWQAGDGGILGYALRVGEPVDGYFDLPLWLQTPCCGHVLWAYNAAHLAFLRSYVGASIRETRKGTSLASELPAWLKSAKNRDEVLRCIDRLRERLQAGNR